MLPLSHDEVVHGKGSLLSKMGGDTWAKFAGFAPIMPSCGLTPVRSSVHGQEFAPCDEWSEARSLDWHLLGFEPHKGVQTLITDLNKLYKSSPAMHGRDCEGEGFQWLIADDYTNSVFAWVRWAGEAAPIVCISNLTPVPRVGYGVPMPRPALD